MRPVLAAAVALIASPACSGPSAGPPPPPPPVAPAPAPAAAPGPFTALAGFDAPDARCTTRDRRPGVALDGACRPIEIHDGGWASAAPSPATRADPRITAAIDRVSRDAGCGASRGIATGDGAVFVHILCITGSGQRHGRVARFDDTGELHSAAVLDASTAQIAFVPGPQPRLAIALCDVGTVVLDARTLAGVAGWRRMGGWFNAASDGPSVSPDGAWIAVPDPYGERIDFVRSSDVTVAGSLRVHDLVPRDTGPGRIVWTPTALEITAFRLPYE